MDESVKRKRGAGYWCCWAVVAVMLYVASMGPAYRIEAELTEATPFYCAWLWGNAPVFDTLYCPINWIADQFFPYDDVGQGLIYRYVQLWFWGYRPHRHSSRGAMTNE